MEFKEAYQKLQELAAGEYNNMRFEVTTHSDGEIKMQCTLYINDYSHTNFARTWEEAFTQMKRKMGLIENEQIPNISDQEKLV